jgi:hypothetical protein
VHEAPLNFAGDTCETALPIPAEGPLSYDGKLFRIIWEVVAEPTVFEGLEPPPSVTAAFRVVPRRVQR